MKTLTRYIISLSLLLSILALTFVAPSPAKAQDTGVTATVSTGTVNLRSGPGLDYPTVDAATLNDEFPVLGRAHGSNRVWYQVKLPNGHIAWISERVVNIYPSPDNVPWLDDSNANTAKVPMVMDCGEFQPLLVVGSYTEVTAKGGLVISAEAGLGKEQLGKAAFNELVNVIDGPFCTRLANNFYQIQWLVETGSGVQGYMLEGRPDGKGHYDAYTILSEDKSTSENQNTENGSNTDRPAKVANSDIAEVTGIFQEVQQGNLTRDDAEQSLQDVVDRLGTDALAWIVRRVPIYDGKTGMWQSFARYDDMSVMTFTSNSQLDENPVSVAADILFGDYTDHDHLLIAIGCGG